jgi:hypothetical protein
VVEARPPSVGYRVSKFLRRHKGQVIAASLVLLALLGGIVGTTLGLVEARRQEEEARKQEKSIRSVKGVLRHLVSCHGKGGTSHGTTHRPKQGTILATDVRSVDREWLEHRRLL